MLPVLVTFGPVRIYAMGLFLALGIFLGLYYWWKLGRDEHWEEIALFDAYFISLIAFFVFGRLGYVALHWNDLGTIYRILAFLTYPGLSYIAGIAGSVISIISVAKAKEWDIWKALDILAVVLSLILIFGFVGAFLNGSNPGRELSWGLTYPAIAGRRFPVDLLGILWALFTFGLTIRVRKSFRFYTWYKGDASIAKDGLAALVSVVAIGVFFVLTGLVDDSLKMIGPIPIVVILGILTIIAAGIFIYRRSGRFGK